MAGNERAIE
jgi:hypothetical protein